MKLRAPCPMPGQSYDLLHLSDGILLLPCSIRIIDPSVLSTATFLPELPTSNPDPHPNPRLQPIVPNQYEGPNLDRWIVGWYPKFIDLWFGPDLQPSEIVPAVPPLRTTRAKHHSNHCNVRNTYPRFNNNDLSSHHRILLLPFLLQLRRIRRIPVALLLRTVRRNGTLPPIPNRRGTVPRSTICINDPLPSPGSLWKKKPRSPRSPTRPRWLLLLAPMSTNWNSILVPTIPTLTRLSASCAGTTKQPTLHPTPQRVGLPPVGQSVELHGPTYAKLPVLPHHPLPAVLPSRILLLRRMQSRPRRTTGIHVVRITRNGRIGMPLLRCLDWVYVVDAR